MEKWKDIEGYEGYYQVSDLGNVRSVDRKVAHDGNGNERKSAGRLIRQSTRSTGNYCTVCLHKDGEQKRMKVHRLVANAFIPNPNGYKEVNHKNEIKQDNEVNNLEWCDRRYNENYGTKKARSIANRNQEAISAKQRKPVLQISIDGEIVKRWNSLKEINIELGYSCGNISMCCNGKYKKPLYGYYWRFA